MKEKRIFKRFDRSLPAKLQVVSPDSTINEKTHYLMTKNICAGGIFLDTKESFFQGSDVIIEIALPVDINPKDHCFIKVKGYILRTEQSGIALSFKKDFQIDFGELPEHFRFNTPYKNGYFNN
jgi:hypothetical protein